MNWDDWSRQLAGQTWAPRAAAIAGVLLLGWLAALALAATVSAVLERTKLDAALSRFLSAAEPQARERVAVEVWISKTVYYVALLFVFVACLERLGLASVSIPINEFLSKLSGFLPRAFGAGLLLFGAFLTARVLRAIVERAANGIKWQGHLAESASPEQRRSLGTALGETAYWLVFLLFLPAVLGTLELSGLLAPVQNLLDQFLAAVPHLAGAGLVLAAGWFMARVVQRVVASLLSAAGADRLSTRLGLGKVLGERSLSEVGGIIVYALVLLPVLVASLNALGFESLTAPASSMLNTMLGAVPKLFGAALLVALSYVIARLSGALAQNVLSGAGFDRVLAKLGVMKDGDADGRLRPSAIAERVVVAGVMLFAAMEAARMLGFVGLAVLIQDFASFGGHVLAGLFLFGVGLFLGNLAAKAIEQSQAEHSRLLALAARVSIIALAGAMALEEVGLAEQIILMAFGLVLGAICLATSLAFGLGSRDIAARELDGWLARLRRGETASASEIPNPAPANTNHVAEASATAASAKSG